MKDKPTAIAPAVPICIISAIVFMLVALPTSTAQTFDRFVYLPIIIRQVPSTWYSTCPLDLTLKGVEFAAAYSSNHIGIDIKAPIGTPLRSPGNCQVLEMYIDGNGTQAFHISCQEFPGIELELGHVDFQLADTIDYFAIPPAYFADGKPMQNSFGFFPKGKYFRQGEPLHVYTSSTGNSGYPHLHITAWTRTLQGGWNANNNPEDFVKCR
jgi:hypothetical protein